MWPAAEYLARRAPTMTAPDGHVIMAERPLGLGDREPHPRLVLIWWRNCHEESTNGGCSATSRCRSCCRNSGPDADRPAAPAVPARMPLRSPLLSTLLCATALAAVALPARRRRRPRRRRTGPDEVVVRYAERRRARRRAHGGAHVRAATRVVKVPPGESVAATARRLQRRAGVLSATPNYIAHASGWVPPDPGNSGTPVGLAGAAVELPARDRRQRAGRVAAPDRPPGAPAARASSSRWSTPASPTPTAGRFRRSPDFSPYRFVQRLRLRGRRPRTRTTTTGTGRTWRARSPRARATAWG